MIPSLLFLAKHGQNIHLFLIILCEKNKILEGNINIWVHLQKQIKKNNLFYKDYTDTSLIYTPWSAHGGHDLG